MAAIHTTGQVITRTLARLATAYPIWYSLFSDSKYFSHYALADTVATLVSDERGVDVQIYAPEDFQLCISHGMRLRRVDTDVLGLRKVQEPAEDWVEQRVVQPVYLCRYPPPFVQLF